MFLLMVFKNASNISTPLRMQILVSRPPKIRLKNFNNHSKDSYEFSEDHNGEDQCVEYQLTMASVFLLSVLFCFF